MGCQNIMFDQKYIGESIESIDSGNKKKQIPDDLDTPELDGCSSFSPLIFAVRGYILYFFLTNPFGKHIISNAPSTAAQNGVSGPDPCCDSNNPI